MKEEKILAAGTYYFSLKGLEGTRIGDITKKANIGKGSFYTYFANKEELLEKIMEVKIEEHISFFNRLNKADVELKEKVMLYLEGAFRSLVEDPKFFYMTQKIFKTGGSALPESLVRKIGKRGDRYMKELLRENIDQIAHEYRDEVEIIAASLTASLFSYQETLAEKVEVEVKREGDYKKISSALKKMDIPKYIDQFYKVNIQAIIKEEGDEDRRREIK